MSKLTDKISYLLGLAEGMKLNPEKDSHRLFLGILDVLDDVGEVLEEQEAAHRELSEYVDSIDEDLSDLEADLYDDEDEEAYEEDEADDEVIEYECPHCGATVPIDPADVDFDEDALCPRCGKELFPELPEDAEVKAESKEDGAEKKAESKEDAAEKKAESEGNDAEKKD